MLSFTLNRLPSRCVHCRVKFSEEERKQARRIHTQCVDAWLAVLDEKKQRKAKAKQRLKAKVERAAVRQRKEADKTWSKWHAEAQNAVNAFVRTRDQGEPCVSCGTPWSADFQAGHYRSRGAAKNLALDLRNIHGQCVQCNLHKHGNAVAYRAGLAVRRGLPLVEALEADNLPRHYSIDDLKSIKAEFVLALKELKKESA